MVLYTIDEFYKEQYDIASMINLGFIKESSLAIASPIFGEIWICEMPILLKNDGTISFEKIARPVLVIDDRCEHFIKHDRKNYYVLKITSQKDTYQRVKINNYERFGLQKESFIRIELPIKVEKSQFLYKIGYLGSKITNTYLLKVKKYLKIS